MSTCVERRGTTEEQWRECESAVFRQFHTAIQDVMLSGGCVTQVSIEIPVHGYKPGHPILGVKKK